MQVEAATGTASNGREERGSSANVKCTAVKQCPGEALIPQCGK